MNTKNMDELKQVEPWYEPTDIFRKEENFVCEMSREDHGFLCGIIKMAKPRKILELGVAEGGTTAVIAKSMEMLGLECEMYSVDINERLYCNTDHETGYIFKEQEKSAKVKHEFLFGKTIAGWIENSVGGGIDLAILDTTHVVPGEILDFLSVLPFMSENGMVVLHDINLNYARGTSKERRFITTAHQRIASKVVLTTVVAEKYLNLDVIPNIGAFRINENTYRHSLGLFFALSLTWTHKVREDLLNEYRNLFAIHYPNQCMEIYDLCVKMNNLMIQNLDKYGRDIAWQFPYESIPYGSRIVLYGAGFVGREIYSFLQLINYVQVVCVVDTNYKKYKSIDTRYMKVDNPEIMSEREFDYILITVENEDTYNEIKRYIVNNNLGKGRPIIGPVKKR